MEILERCRFGGSWYSVKYLLQIWLPCARCRNPLLCLRFCFNLILLKTFRYFLKFALPTPEMNVPSIDVNFLFNRFHSPHVPTSTTSTLLNPSLLGIKVKLGRHTRRGLVVKLFLATYKLSTIQKVWQAQFFLCYIFRVLHCFWLSEYWLNVYN